MILNQNLMDAVRTLSDAGCNYRLDELADCYEPDLQIFTIKSDGSMLVFNYEQNMAFFRERRDAGAPPINTSIHFNIAEVQGGTGFVTATRRMDLGYGAGVGFQQAQRIAGVDAGVQRDQHTADDKHHHRRGIQ